MKKLKALAALLLALTLVFGLTVGAYADWDWDFGDDDDEDTAAETGNTDPEEEDDDYFGWLWDDDDSEDADEESEEDTDDEDLPDTVDIKLDGNKAEYDCEAVDSEDGVVEILAGGKYSISGKADDMQILVDAKDEDVELILDDAEIICCGSPAIYVDNAASITVTLASGSKNTVSCVVDNDTYDRESEYTALYSEADVEISGDGRLDVECEYGYGIVSAKDITVKGCGIEIETADYAIFAAGKLHIEDCELDITSGGVAVYGDMSDSGSDETLSWDYDWGYDWGDDWGFDAWSLDDDDKDSSCEGCEGCDGCDGKTGSDSSEDSSFWDFYDDDFWDSLYGGYGSDYDFVV